ncbi:MAG: FtsW/RodA/SpoVE family cell cycle protein, partial [Clostridia bacterium]|nr:FtsW/RodA/SpoVE family cell cycle protein [Clostridia bacterium]
MAIKAIHPDEAPKKTKKRASKLKKNIKKSQNTIKKAVNERNKKHGEMDYTFFLLTAVLAIIGLIMLLSASTPAANVKFGRSYYFFIRQFGYSAIGFIFMYGISFVDYHKYKKYANIGILVGIVLLVFVLIPHIGIERNGSRRWLGVGPITFQPTELVKFLIALFFASAISDKRYDIKKLDGLAKYGLWILFIVAPIMLETHLSGAIVISGIAICLLIVGGANMKYIITGACGLLAAGTAVAVL